MKKYLKMLGLGALFVGLAGFGFLFFVSPHDSIACGGRGGGSCGWGGSQGGADYVPQQRGSGGWWPGASSRNAVRGSDLSQDQARGILARHVARLNPELKVGPMEDAGSFYKADVFSKNNEVVDRLGIDKQSGRLMPVN
ncbi:MAG: hypothetical protein HN366_03720 [Deltaproteobacteria bacterium]|nr:hypothetical protein [Deltaproteobacteria bacterium]